MLLRSTIEKHLPVMSDEARLVEADRRAAFRGFYFPFGSTLRGFGTYDDPNPKNYSRPYSTINERHNNLTNRNTRNRGSNIALRGSGYYTSSGTDERFLNRARRVEKIARRIKYGTAVLLASVAAGVAVESDIDWPSFKSAEPAIPINDCKMDIDGTQPLIPIEIDKIPEAQRLGQTVCRVGEYNFVFTPSPEPAT